MKVCFISPRYGNDVVGGAEFYCRKVAEHMSKYWDIEVVTTCAKDYVTWKNEYPDGIEYVNGVKINRFKNDFERPNKFHRLYLKILGDINPCNFYEKKESIIKNIHRSKHRLQKKCLTIQGPYSTSLLNFLKKKKNYFDLFIFFIYLYPTTFLGVEQVPKNKVALVPTIHDEPILYFSVLNGLLDNFNYLIFSTVEERNLTISRFSKGQFSSDIIGLGIDIPEINLSDQNFREKFNINEKFILYVGRIDESKGCKELIEYYLFCKRLRGNKAVKLVLMGKETFKIPNHPDIICLGFVSEEDKFAGMHEAELLVASSPYESLSLVILESWMVNTPVLVNGKCDVLKGQCIRSNGGLWYESYDEFKECLNLMLGDEQLRNRMGKNGKEFVEKNYSWDVIEHKYLKLFENIYK